MSTDITFCANATECSIADKCQRAHPPKGCGVYWYANFYPTGTNCSEFKFIVKPMEDDK